eukprot:Skav203700  [mRNA]  locus=scaffold259:302693:303709:+ [translate_table: standard]
MSLSERAPLQLRQFERCRGRGNLGHPGTWVVSHVALSDPSGAKKANLCDGFQSCRLRDGNRWANLDFGDAAFLRATCFWYTAHYDRGQAPQEVTMGFTARDVEECGQCKDNTIVRSESLLSEQVQQGSHTIRVGLDSLNSLSKEPIIRDLSHIDHL